MTGRCLVMVAALAGCTQILGLEDTRFDQQDAPTDAPSVCDGAPACLSSTGRSACGQIFGLGAQAGVPLRVAHPTGMACDTLGSAEGPCALSVVGMAKSSLFGSMTAATPGAVDDCGRFAVNDLDASVADVALVVAGPGHRQSATLVLGRPTSAGIDTGIEAFAMTDDVAATWGSQLGPTPTPLDIRSAYLIRYTRNGAPVPIAPFPAVTKDSMNAFTNAPGATPWAAYFSGPTGFDTLDPTATHTNETGTALAVFGGGTFSLEGVRMGVRCKVPAIQQVSGTLIFVIATAC